MYLLYIDESGEIPQEDKGPGRFFVIAGVIVAEGAWRALTQELAALKKQMRIEGEIKWKFFGTGNNSQKNNIRHLDIKQKDVLRSKMYEIITSRKSCTLLACVTSTHAAYGMRSIKDSDDIYNLTYKAITERFQYFLQERERNVGSAQLGMIIADHRQSGNDQRLRAKHHDLMSGVLPHFSEYSNLVETIFFTPSELNPGIQFADMVAGAVHRAYQYKDKRWLNMIKKSFRQDRDGNIEGFGLVRMPKKGWA